MCGRFTLRTPANLLVQQFALDFQGELTPRYNIAPTQSVPVIRLDQERRQLVPLRWGLVPFWSKEPSAGGRMINARGETVATKPAFRQAFQRRRCLVPADGYLEWRREGKQKQPYYIRMRDEQPFAMAGLWERWRGDGSSGEQTTLETFTVITTESNDLTREIHDRMPVILGPNDYQKWLCPDFQETSELVEMLQPYDSNEMRMDAVSTRVNSVRNDDPECLEIQRSLF